jgi:tetratricopeptide (TPR) repeat protein
MHALVLAIANQSIFERSSTFGKYAILFFDALMKNYPDFSQTGMCYYNKALIYDLCLGNLSEAENQYREFMAKYPEHPLTPNIQAYLDNIFRKSEDQIMAEFLEKNKDNAGIEDVPVEYVKAR